MPLEAQLWGSHLRNRTWLRVMGFLISWGGPLWKAVSQESFPSEEASRAQCPPHMGSKETEGDPQFSFPRPHNPLLLLTC